MTSNRHIIYFARYQSVSGENGEIETCISKEFADLYLLLSSIFSKLVRYIAVCVVTLFCKHAAKTLQISCQLALRNVVLSYRLSIHRIIYELRANMDHIENLMALSILRATEDSSCVKIDMKWWASEKSNIVQCEYPVRSVICQECLDIRSLSLRTRAWMFPYLTLIAIEFRQAEFGKFSGEISNFHEIFVNSSYIGELENELCQKERTVALVIFFFFILFFILQEFRKNSMLTTILREGKGY